MVKFIQIITLVLGLGHIGIAQNLVPNFDFSQRIQCGGVQVNTLSNQLFNWFEPPLKPSDSIYRPNFISWPNFDTCFAGFEYGYDTLYKGPVSNPCVAWIDFFPYPKAGSNYIALSVIDSYIDKRTWYYRNCINTNTWFPHSDSIKVDIGRSFAEVKLSNNLVPSEQYIIEYHVMSYDNPSLYAIKNLGAYVSTDTFYHFDYKKNNLLPTIEASSFVFENRHWVKIKGSFTATGNEQFLTVGNFRKDSLTSLQMLPADTNRGNSIGPSYFIDAVYLYLHTDTLFEVNLPADTTLCPNDSLTLYAVHDDGFKLEDTVKTFLWSTGSTDSSITISQPGWYWVKVEYNHRFWQSDTILVEHSVPPYSSGLPLQEEGCQGDEIKLRAQPDINRLFVWNNGEKGTGITATDSGYYWLSAISSCDTVVDSVLVNLINCDTVQPPLPVYIPNAFSPNGDGLNDTWHIANLPEENELAVFNRWGEVIFKRKNYQGDWDGTGTDGKPIRPGIYIYSLSYEAAGGKTETVQDWVMILDK